MMDLVIGLWWSAAFTVIIVVLGALNYFLGQSHSDIQINEKKSSSDSANLQQQQSTRNSNSSQRRKQARTALRKQRQLAALAATSNSDHNEEDSPTSESISATIKLDEDDVQPIDQFEDPMMIEDVLILPTHVEDEQTVPQQVIKQRNKNPTPSIDVSRSNSLKEESIQPSKPQACVAPVKQPLLTKSSIAEESKEIRSNHHSKSNGTNSTCHIYSHPEYNSLPPRFQQQRQQKFLSRKSTDRTKKPSFGRTNHFLPPPPRRQHQQYSNNHHQLDTPPQNGYSSESDVATGRISLSVFLPRSSRCRLESSSTAPPPSIESQYSFKRSDNHSPSSNHNLDEFLSLFDSTSFNSDQLELILNKISTNHLSTRQDRQYSSINRTDKTLEALLDETYRSHAKILAHELQTEKNRVHELSKINADLDTTIRQLQQPNPNIPSYQQTILHYQMQLKRLTDDNTRLVQQLHAYSIMPATINELKQQHIILNEQLRQISMRYSNLEKDFTDGERARKQAAEIYQKGEKNGIDFSSFKAVFRNLVDTQKQARIDQLVNDLNKYKKMEKDLQSLQEKHLELENNFQSKLTDLTEQRDHLHDLTNELQSQIESHQTNRTPLEQELIELKMKNDLLRQRNWKIMEQLNKLRTNDEQSTD